MKRFISVPSATGLIVASLLAGGCADRGLQPAAVPPAYHSGLSVSKSWIAPAAARGRLLYVADSAMNAVLVYTYPQLTGAGILTGFVAVEGVCTDPRGYVWVLSNDETVTEFDHGGTQPINVLRPGNYSGDPGVTTGCSVNPKNGDLAVAGYDGVTVFLNGQENHLTYLDGNFSKISYVAYDKLGNLFMDGTTAASDFLFAELAASSPAISEITLSGGTVSTPGGIQWDGKYLDVGDGASGNIYQTDGTTILATVSTGAACGGQFAITENHKRVVVPDSCGGATGVYRYPAGGPALKTVRGQSQPLGAAISAAHFRR